MVSPERLEQIATSLLFFFAGGCLFLFLVNRVLLQLNREIFKRVLAVLLLLVLVFVPGWYGYQLGRYAWSWVPALVIGALAAEEIWQMRMRRRLRVGPAKGVPARRVRLGRPLTTLDLAVSRYAVDLAGWQGPDFRVVHISDLHATRRAPLQYFQDAMQLVSEARPDLLFLTGDFVSRIESLPVLAGILPLARARLGAFGVLGNHDHGIGAARVAAVLEENGVQVLGNSSRTVRIGDRADLVISGCDDPWGPSPWQAPAAQAGAPLFVLAHTADNIYRLNRAGAAAVFCGHYHAGQWSLPLWGPVLIPSVFGRRFDHGHFMVGKTHLFVSAGIGASEPRLRLYCQPDVFVVDVRKGTAEA